MQALLPISPGEGLDAQGLEDAAAALAAAGVEQLVLREPWLGGARLRAVAEALVTRLPGLILHARSPGAVEVAEALGLTVHLRDGDPPPARARFGQSCHSVSGARAAAAAGARYVTLSPAFRSGSKPGDLRPTLGPRALGEAQRQLTVPVFALGGVGPAEATALRREGVFGVAMIHSIFGGSPSPAQIQERCRMILRGLH